VPDPDLKDGWNQEARGVAEKVLEKPDTFPGLRLYSDLALALEEKEGVTWRFGGRYCRNGNAHVVRVENGRINCEQVSEEQAKGQGVSPTALEQRADDSFHNRTEPLVTLGEPELRLESGSGGGRQLVGRVRATPLFEQPLRYALLVVHQPAQEKRGPA